MTDLTGTVREELSSPVVPTPWGQSVLPSAPGLWLSLADPPHLRVEEGVHPMLTAVLDGSQGLRMAELQVRDKTPAHQLGATVLCSESGTGLGVFYFGQHCCLLQHAGL